MAFLPFSPLAWEKGLGVEGLLRHPLNRVTTKTVSVWETWLAPLPEFGEGLGVGSDMSDAPPSSPHPPTWNVPISTSLAAHDPSAFNTQNGAISG